MIQVTPDQPGTAQVFLVDAFDGATLHAQGSAIAEVANVPNIFLLEMPVRGTFQGVVLRFTNTNSTPGVASFSASDGG